MKSILNSRWSGFLCAIVSTIVMLSIVFSYHEFVQETNEYLGYKVIAYAAFDYLMMGGAVSLFALSIKNGVRKPSDYFFLIYILFVVVPYSALVKSRGELGEEILFLGALLLVAPLLFFYLVRKICFSINYRGFLSWSQTNFVVYGIVGISILLLLSSGISSAGFDMDTSYGRRLEGREVFQTGAISSYLISMVANSMLPLVGFWSGFYRQSRVFLVAVAGCIILFFYLGLKAPLLYVIIGAGFGWFGHKFGFRGTSRFFVFAVLVVFMASFIEIFCFDYSYFADYVIRRAFAVPPFLVSAYLEMFSQPSGYWELARGSLSDLPVTMFMGEYLGDSMLNANTNTFLYALGSLGLFGYFLDIVLVCLAFGFIDCLYRQRKDPALMWVGFLFSLLLVEQSSKTVLVSSGVALSLLLLFLGRTRVE